MKTGEFKAPSGLIRAELRVRDDSIQEIKFTGDFFFYPEDELEEFEKIIEGSGVDREELTERVREFYESRDVRTPGLEPESWVEAIERALGGE